MLMTTQPDTYFKALLSKTGQRGAHIFIDRRITQIRPLKLSLPEILIKDFALSITLSNHSSFAHFLSTLFAQSLLNKFARLILSIHFYIREEVLHKDSGAVPQSIMGR